MYGFYNEQAWGDLLLIGNGNNLPTTKVVTLDKLIIIYSGDQIIGYHLLNAREIFEDLKSGINYFTEEMVKRFNDLLKENKLSEETYIDYQAKFIVGEIVSCIEHPQSNKLKVCVVDIHDEMLQIVTNATNAKEKEYVIVALEGAVLPSGVIISHGKVMQVESYGMFCSFKTLGLKTEQSSGIAILDRNKYHIGQKFQL